MIPIQKKARSPERPAGFSTFFQAIKGRLAPQHHCGRRQLFVAAGRVVSARSNRFRGGHSDAVVAAEVLLVERKHGRNAVRKRDGH